MEQPYREDKTRYKNDIVDLNKKMENLHEQIAQIEEKPEKKTKKDKTAGEED